MIGPQLQKAIFDRLKAAGIAGGRVYDRVPTGAAAPYVEIGDDQVIDDGDQCSDIFEVFTDVHVWSEAVGRVEAKAIGKEVCDAMKAELTVAGYHVVVQEFRSSRILSDPDDKTTHGLITFRFLLQPV